jgi:hypothetical protein
MSLLKTYSELLRPPTLAENQYRAANNEIVTHQIDNDAVTIRAQYPSAQLTTYNLHRLILPATAAEWNTYAGAGAESGYIHHSGVRRQMPSGHALEDYYVMNMGHAPYVAWQALRSVRAIEGTMYSGGVPPGQHNGLNMDAVQVDLTMWYAAFDSPWENVLTSDEYKVPGGTYPGGGAAYSAACVSAFITVRNAVTAAHPAARTYPNFGDLAYIGSPPAAAVADTAALVAASSLIEAQQAFSYFKPVAEVNGEPNLNATACEAAWATIAATAGKDLLAHGLWISGDKDRAKTGTCAWFLMGARDGLFARFATATDAPEDIATWEQPDLLRSASAELGAALGPYEKVVGGAWSKGNVYHREFASGRAYLFVRKAGQVGSETAVLSIRSSRPFLIGGGFGPSTSMLSLTLGEGAVLKNAEAEVIGTSPIRICEGTAPIGPPITGISPIETTVEGSSPMDERN